MIGLALLVACGLPANAADGTGAATDAGAASVGGAAIDNSVVKVFATMRYPDPFRPWTKQAPSEVTASGVVIEGRRILTNAHAVLYASQVQIQANQAGDKISATVEAIAPGIDLAVLKLDDASFFAAHAPLARASALPAIKDAVLAYGYPTGGNSLSITKGIVSRIEFMPYALHVSGLRIQIDAAINPGNSGGPAIVGDRMIGLAFSTLGDAQNIGYIIPNEEIELFLKDIADGHYDGKPQMYDELQTLENPALRAYLRLDGGVSGVIVRRPFRSDAGYPLRQWDVITRIADTPIDDQGMVRLGENLRVSFHYLVQQVAVNGRIPLGIVRAGKPLQIQLPVAADYPALIPSLSGAYPPYFIYGPLVFSRATLEFFAFASNNAAMMRGLGAIGSPLITRLGDAPDAATEELVVVAAPFFPHRLAQGYGNPSASVLYAVNGTRIRSLRHLVALLRDLKDDYVSFEMGHRGAETLVFPRKEMVAATNDILTDNGVRSQGSAELLAIWQGQTAH